MHIALPTNAHLALPKHPLTGLTALGIVGGRPVWPILGGAPDDGAAGAGQSGQSGGAGAGGSGQGAGAAGEGQNGQGAADQGFPENTPVADMTVEQQAAYWKAQSRKHEGRASARQDYDAIKAERDRLKSTHQTAEEKALEDARNEGRTAATNEVNNGAVTAIVEASLRLRGYTDERIASATKYLNPAPFVTNGSIDTAAISGYVDSIAGPATGQTPDFGAGNRGSSARITGAAAGLAEAEKRFGKKQK